MQQNCLPKRTLLSLFYEVHWTKNWNRNITHGHILDKTNQKINQNLFFHSVHECFICRECKLLYTIRIAQQTSRQKLR